jgi:hypothetical protein
MEKQKVIEWMLANLPDLPNRVWYLVELPFEDWEWFSVCSESFAMNTETGELITKDDFYDARNESRLTPCGMSFIELIEDLKL